MPKTSLNVKPSYCPRWTMQHAVREVIQNAQDCKNLGGTAEYTHRGDTLTVTSTGGGSLDERALVFGETSKADNSRAIGQFGDGLKVALVVFARLGVAVRIDTGRQFWTLSVDDGVVHVVTRNKAAATHRDRAVFEIPGVSVDDWREWRKVFLFLSDGATNGHSTGYKTPWGTVLTDPCHKGCIYVQGILIERRDRLACGYNFDRGVVTISRDREVVDSWNMEYIIRHMLGHAAKSDAGAAVTVMGMLSNDSEDLRNLSNPTAVFGSDFAAKALQSFQAAHGNALAVSSQDEALKAGQNGFSAVLVPLALRKVLESAGLTSVEMAIDRRSTEIIEVHTLSSLNADEQERLNNVLGWLNSALATAGESTAIVEVVTFANTSLLGLHDGATGIVKLARRNLSDTGRTAATLIHEVAHRAGGDGTAEHRQEIERLFGLVAAARFGA
jgi:hypothetical protein